MTRNVRRIKRTINYPSEIMIYAHLNNISSWLNILPEELLEYIWKLVYSSEIIEKIQMYGMYKNYLVNSLNNPFMNVRRSVSDNEYKQIYQLTHKGVISSGNILTCYNGNQIIINNKQPIIDNIIKNILRPVNEGRTCGIFNTNIITSSLQIYMLIRYLPDDWKYLGYSDSTRKATRITNSMFKGASNRSYIPYLQDISLNELKSLCENMSGIKYDNKNRAFYIKEMLKY